MLNRPITIVTGHISATCSYIREVHIRLLQKRIRATNKKWGVSFGFFIPQNSEKKKMNSDFVLRIQRKKLEFEH